MGEHSKKHEAGRVVYSERCAEDYVVPDGQPSIFSADDLEQLQAVSIEHMPGALDEDREYFVLNNLKNPVIDPGRVEIFYVCPNPHDGNNKPGSYCGSFDKSEFQFDGLWECTDCGTILESEEDAEECCAYKRRRSTPVEIAPRNLNQVFDMNQVAGQLTNDQLRAEIERRGAQVILENNQPPKIVIPETKEDWGLT